MKKNDEDGYLFSENSKKLNPLSNSAPGSIQEQYEHDQDETPRNYNSLSFKNIHLSEEEFLESRDLNVYSFSIFFF